MVAGAKVEGKIRANKKKINEIINIALLTLLVPEKLCRGKKNVAIDLQQVSS